MGCDFSIYGNQGDPSIRARCLDFVREWMSLVWKDIPDDEDRSVEGLYPVESGLPFVRTRAGTFKDCGSRLSEAQHDDDITCAWDQGMVTGLVLPWRPDPFIFDTKLKHRLCHFRVEQRETNGVWRPVREFWSVALDMLDDSHRLVLAEGFDTRIPAGTAHFYVFAEVMRRHFISDCEVQADYDMQFYEQVFAGIGLRARLGSIGETTLAARVIECAQDAQAIYDRSVEESERHNEEKRQAAEARFVKRLGPWEREVFFATKFAWGFMKDLPLLGLQDVSQNPIFLNSLKGDLEDWDVGSEMIRQVGLSDRLVLVLESLGVKTVRDMLMFTEADLLQLNGFDECDVKEIREVALHSLGRDSAHKKGKTVKFQLGDDI